MGEVYLAHHPAIGREVAIKTILPSAAKGEDAEGRFRREAEAAGKLNHPNLVTIFDFDKDEDVLFLVMEFVKGDDLEDLIKQGVLSQAQFLEVLAQVCDGLSHAHRNGIIHRDIKPANVRVMRDGKNLLAKVMDFGIARMDDSNLTATGIVMGTVSYMAPEYIRSGHATSQSDLFAVGVMLYECLTGHKPFAGDNTTTILFKIVSDPPPPIDPGLIHGISPSIRQVLDQALSKEPSGRFQTADALGKALRACKDPTWSGSLGEATALIALHQPEADGTQLLQAVPLQMGVPAQAAPAPSGPAPVPAVSAPAPARSRAGLFGAAGLAALAVVGGGAYAVLRPKAPPPAEPTASPAQASASAPAAVVPTPPQPAPTQTAQAPAANPPQAVAAVAPRDTPRGKPQAPGGQAKAMPTTPEPVKAKPEPPKVEPPKPEAPGKAAAALIVSDPRQAAAQLKPLVQNNPGSVELNANYLAALYRSNNPGEFDRALMRAELSGVTPKAMFVISALRSAIIDERALTRAHNNKGTGVLPEDVMKRFIAGL
jgi:serine/threonine-protein kinase